MKIFDIKQKIGAFLLKEDGKISKKSILGAGIILGAVALSSKIANAQEHTQNYSDVVTLSADGSCYNADPKFWTAHPGTDAIHTNAAHANRLDVKNFFGKLNLSHAHCIATHTQNALTHAQHYVHDSHCTDWAGAYKPC